MRKDFVNEVARAEKIQRIDLLEKDLILHQVLMDLSNSRFFRESFAFKGETCLAKCYLDYFRFSEDIDFSWKNQGDFEGKSQKEIRRYLSTVIDRVGGVFEAIAEKRGLDFKCIKENRNYVELGGGNKTCTFKVWYDSEVLGRKSFLKVQINFVERLVFPLRSVELKSLLSEEREEVFLLFPEFKEYAQKICFDVYDPREILCEKVRAILTRRGVKARDFVDVYLISREFGIELESVRDCCLEKAEFALGLYSRYRENLEAKKGVITTAPFSWGEEEGLLLRDVGDSEFYAFVNRFKVFLERVIEALEDRSKSG